MSKYIFICQCDLKHGINIDERFLKKKIPIKILEHSGFVLFPTPKCNKEYGFKLINPKTDSISGEYYCGDYITSSTPDGTPILRPRISKVYFKLYIDTDIEVTDQLGRIIIQEIERLASKFIKCISIIHPSAVRWSYSKEEAYIEPIDRFSLISKDTNKDVGPTGTLKIHLTSPSEQVTTDEFFNIFRNINRLISLQHSLLADTERCFARGEYREVVLNCATIIEKTLKEQIISYLAKEQTGSNIKKQILKHSNGFSKIQELMKAFRLPQLSNSGKIKTLTIDIRDEVIHKGVYPSKKQAEEAIRHAKQVIEEYQVPLFELT